MGVHIFMYGDIKEAWSGSRANGCEELWRQRRSNDCSLKLHNENLMGALPDEDGWPPMTRHMFGCAAATEAVITYIGPPFNFAASFKDVDFEVRDWFKFEALSNHTFSWRPMPEWIIRLSAELLELNASWDFNNSMDAEDLEGLRANRS